MVGSNTFKCALSVLGVLIALGLLACSDSSGSSGGVDASGAGGTGDTDPLPREQEVLLIGGFMSELYEALSLHLEDELNAALRGAARTLNVNIELPLNRSVDIPIGDAVADALPRINLPIEPGGFITFYTQELHFAEQGLLFRNISRASSAFNASESVAHNADAILAYLLDARAQRKQIVIVSHSKGGLDTLDALLRPEASDLLGDTVVGWVALQAPFYGSPVADPAPSVINDVLLSALGGNGESLDDLKTAGRETYMAARVVDNPAAPDIGDITSAIPVISAYNTYEAGGTVTGFASAFASSILDAALVSQITQIVVDNYWNTPLDIPGVINRSTTAAVNVIGQRAANALDAAIATIGLMDLTNVYMNTIIGVPNDGLVPFDSTALPGAIHRELDLGDHASPVMDVDPLKNFWTAQHRNAVTESLVEEVRRLAGVVAAN